MGAAEVAARVPDAGAALAPDALTSRADKAATAEAGVGVAPASGAGAIASDSAVAPELATMSGASDAGGRRRSLPADSSACAAAWVRAYPAP